MNSTVTRNPIRRRQRGTTLLEALVAFLVLSLGMLSVARVQTQLRANADVARQRSEAVRLAQEEMESLRGFAVIAAAAGARSYDSIVNDSRSVDASTGYATNTRYQLTRRIDAAGAPRAKNASVTVGWVDRGGAAQQVALNSIIAGSDPAYSGALGLARGGLPTRGPFERSVRVPLGAKDLGDGSSVFKPHSAGSAALRFDNATGMVTARCTGIDPARATRDLSAADLTSCDANAGLLLSGVVRFTAAVPPNPAQANDQPPAFDIVLALSGGVYPLAPVCTVEALKTVSYVDAGGLRIDGVPLAATPATFGLAGWADTGARHAAYHCVVYPAANGQWSGRSTLAPIGWSIGTAPTDGRVCRHATDLDASGAVDTNLEHPPSYSAVTGTLAQQNFLVVGGGEACPGGSALRVEGNSADVFANLGTVQHQP